MFYYANRRSLTVLIWLAKQIFNPYLPALTWVGNIWYDPQAKHISHLALLSRILKRKQLVMLIVSLFQLDKQVGPKGQNRSFIPLTVCAKHGLYSFQWHLWIKQCLSKQNTSSTAEDNYQFSNKWRPLIHIRLYCNYISSFIFTMSDLSLPGVRISCLSSYSMLFIQVICNLPLWLSALIAADLTLSRNLTPVSSQQTDYTSHPAWHSKASAKVQQSDMTGHSCKAKKVMVKGAWAMKQVEQMYPHYSIRGSKVVVLLPYLLSCYK